MDMSSLLGVLTSSDAINNMGKATKTDASVVESVLNAALPSLLGGAQQQSQGQDTAESFAQALMSHGQKDADDLSAFMGNVDLDDGAKIVAHLLGGQDSSQLESISRAAGVSTKQANGILSAAAPLLMALLGKQILQNLLGGNNNNANTSNVSSGAVNSLAGSLLQNAMGGGLLNTLLGGGAVNNNAANNTIPFTNETAAPVNNSKPSLLGTLLGGLFK